MKISGYTGTHLTTLIKIGLLVWMLAMLAFMYPHTHNIQTDILYEGTFGLRGDLNTDIYLDNL